MKKTFLLLSIIISSIVTAQTAEDIVKNYYKGIGGQQLEKVHAILQKGKMVSNGMEFPLESYQNTNGQMYTKMNLMGQDMTMVAFDGQKGYVFDNATFGYKDIPDSLANVFKNKAKNLFGYFYNYKKAGHKIKYLGKQKLEGKEYDKVQLNLSEPVEKGVENIFAYFNPETHLLSAVEIKNNGHIVITENGDYKTFDNIKLPTKIVTKVDGNPMVTMQINEVKINPPQPDKAIFIKPKQ